MKRWMSKWRLGEKSKHYGRVVGMAVIEGEKYRFFISKDKVISMIPLSVLELEEQA
jgi:hypothetical protein